MPKIGVRLVSFVAIAATIGCDLPLILPRLSVVWLAALALGAVASLKDGVGVNYDDFLKAAYANECRQR